MCLLLCALHMASAVYHRHYTVSGAAVGVRDELAATEKKRATGMVHRNDTRLLYSLRTVPAAMSMDGLRTIGCSRMYVRDGAERKGYLATAAVSRASTSD